MKAQHTPGSERIAEILIPEGIDRKGHASTITTAWGKKTREGIADLIDNETHAPELIEALQKISTLADEGVIQRNETGKPTWSLIDALKEITRPVIAKATGEA